MSLAGGGILLAVFVVSLLLTGFMASMMRRREALLDVPNERSSHTRPTPRGGGAVFSVMFLLAVAAYGALPIPHRPLWIALGGGGSLVALVGWLDDWRGLPSYPRLGLYAIGAAWAAAWIGGIPSLSLGFAHIPLGWIGYPLAWAAILALTNIYNFMDGIDGLATSEGITASATAGALLLATGEPYLGFFLLGMACALLGLLRWNWRPAKIFMGDVGSNLLGFAFAVLAIYTDRVTEVSLWIWVVLLGVFVVDGLLTFGRRLIRRLPPYQAHRSHAYQGAVLRGYSHDVVSGSTILINCVLGGVAVAIWRRPTWTGALVFASYVVLAGIHWYYSPLRLNKDGSGKRVGG